MGAHSSKSPPNGGLRVHRVYPNGPGDVAGIEPFFDYVLDADGYTYTDDSDETLNLFTKYVSDHENQQICLNVYNARKKNIREVFIVPQKWDGIGFLGLTLKFGLFNCLDEGAHIVHVYDKSPAQKAGLMPITDYLLGTNMQLFFDLDCVRIHVANQVDKEVVLIVYNSVTETVRRALIVPRENWGGKGTLGCDLAKGYIHRIPYVKALFTYPSIETYSTYDSNNAGEVVDTIDLSIGNVDNYYNNSANTTLRQDDSQRQQVAETSETAESGAPFTAAAAPQNNLQLEVKFDGSGEPLSEHESHQGDLQPDHSQSDYQYQHDQQPPPSDDEVRRPHHHVSEEQAPDPDVSYESSDSYKPPTMLNLQSDYINLDLVDNRRVNPDPSPKGADEVSQLDKGQLFQL
ncbi:uncharacterized protein TOT_030000595 [Theileria orientalis strain Shintoku]|uniref:PDZ GRASP-type domain-containing protein n=1 Tax=Theileria orientalis strain Shintoku TaxID=869250 RepID=J4CDL1_THEOR|nr:uncharacterized protein TOT_030000595 [Theileria orientalis strain Shintoku]PVC49706.1 hypothetical protein MACL_00002812 [Theileria orientalis]BAM41332.1 uncharacterized protein TOT_030000595 [Theileria orientalis strain Shintoku]|eukprot:XP_009691633.1 uncharacterized protein TOT_030000595 [Theileria orientalis strain Shintoku]